jgi:2-keto-4-pentenoate hydratase/2-oxohepta-3-ene-1,7-dioic acid hydratase in catechol pathway
MRLLTCDREGAPRLALLLGEAVFDLTDAAARLGGGPLPSDMLGLIAGGEEAWARARELAARLGQGEAPDLGRPLAATRLLAPSPRPAKNIVCVGLNYADHARETRQEVSPYPVFFTKPPTTVIGPEQPIPWYPSVSTRIDWEAELAVVIGRPGRDISEERALEHVFGYTVANDVSARDLQRRHVQWYKGKSLDGFCPLGPWIVTADEIPDPQAMAIRLRLNGEVKQDSTTAQMVYSVARLIAVLSAGLTLETGDLIITGTPAGVGFVREPPEYLSPGDVVEAEIEGIGLLRNPVAQEER